MCPEGDGWYFYDIPGHREVNVLFSDNGINQIPESNQTGYTVSGERWFVNGTWYDSEPEADITNIRQKLRYIFINRNPGPVPISIIIKLRMIPDLPGREP